MKTPPSLAAKVIETHQLNSLAAYDQQERLRLFFVEGSPDELVQHLADLVRDLDGTFLVKAWRKEGNPKGGRRPHSGQVYSWLLQGRKPEAAEQPVQGTAPGVPQNLLEEIAQLRAEKLMRERMDAMQEEDEDEEEETAGPDPMGQLVGLLTNLLLPKAPADATVAGAERGHPSALQGERLERIVSAIRNLHKEDPGTFAQYETALLQTYGKTA